MSDVQIVTAAADHVAARLPLTIADLERFKATPTATSYPASRRTFYAPIDDVHGALVAVLASARQSVVLSMYGFTDEELAALLAKHLDDPTIYCQVTLDRSQATGRTEKQMLALFKAHLDSNVIAIGTSEHGAIVHRKMLIVDGLWTVTGSTNWSLGGEQKQDNELTVTCDATVAAEARHVLDLSHAKALTDMDRARAKTAA